MGFLNPLLLVGAAAVAVPIIIHLLNRRKFQRVVWGAMRFIKASVDQNQRRMKIEDLILLALRCLILILLALALSRPAMKSSTTDIFGQTKVTGVLLLDNSFSMGVSDGVETRFDKARKAAEQAIDALPAGSATAVLLASDIAQGLIPEPTYDLNLARKAIREAKLSDRASDLAPPFRRRSRTSKAAPRCAKKSISSPMVRPPVGANSATFRSRSSRRRLKLRATSFLSVRKKIGTSASAGFPWPAVSRL